ncbi:receptor family ligand binding region domain-containing protein [Ditylenchus destructor]|uniref:Receptor family ligand binding region domain-containing protein n=1 Tax=Ditylenchus destructor TaxID=166010 RepID=A0AAD4R6Z4_9BILA|nr:receptor family ligand binding region domain-containing protein [Ditylenchus destructor]
MLYSHVTLLMLRVVDVISKTTVQQSARMLVAEFPGDIQIGALFPMHRQIAGAEGCGAIWEQYGIQRAEMAVLTVQELNKHLPFRLGISIRDSCWTERIAMEQTIAFLREGVTQCSCCQTAGCQKKANPVVAIVGPAKSSTTIAVQNLLQVFRIPQIGYAATTTDLSDKEQFGYYLRVVPSDAWQARAINQLLRHFNWTYIAVVYSAGNYGEKGFEALERLTHDPHVEVCIAHAQKVKSLANDKEFEEVLKSLFNLKPRPQVVVCFCEGLSMRKLFNAQKKMRMNDPLLRTFQWIGSDGWADRLDVVENVEEEAAGSFSIRIHSPKVESFEPHYFSLNPINHTKNPWFREFWQQKFKCQLTVPKDDTVTPVCTGKENLTLGYEQDPKLSQVINAIRVVGFALKAMYNDKCKKDNARVLCPEMETVNGTLLYRYMINVTFVDQFQQEISFDKNGDPPAWYDILNYVGKDVFRLAGDFRQTRGGTHILRMSDQPKMFYDKSSVLPESVCSKPCSKGQRQRQTTACCWICEACTETQIVNYTTNKCQNCPLGYWPADNRTSCFPLPHLYQPITTPSSMLALIFASIGILCTTLVIVLFLMHNATPVVKSTTRELSYIILGGICACYASTFFIVSKPSFITCFVSRTWPPISFAIVYSALLTKTNRIARILAGSKKRILTKKPRFLTTSSQVVITWTLVGIQCVIVAVGVLEEMPQAGFDSHFMPNQMVLICSSSTVAFMAPFIWNFLLILFCTLYAFKTRNLPENFNEAKFIGFTMYCTLVVWAAFVVLYFNAINKALTMSYTFSISATIALALLFFPKIFIILLHPEKNVRSSYTTTKLIRCHFGNSQAMSDSKHFSSGKTRTSSQSISISCPTRTASLRVARDNQDSTKSAGSTTGALNTSNNTSTGNATGGANHQLHTHSPQRHRDVASQTDQSGLTGSTAQTPSASSRFMRTFSVMGGGGIAGATNGSETPSRRKTLDDDVLQLIDSCRRYQDERLHSHQIQNFLLEEEGILEEEEHVTQLLAGTIEKGMRTMLSTVSKTASIATPKMSTAIPVVVPPSTGSDKECTPPRKRSQHESSSSGGLPVLPWRKGSMRGIRKPSRQQPTPSEHIPAIKEGEVTVEPPSVTVTNDTNAAEKQDDERFEKLLRSKGVQPVHLSNATQL